MGGILAWIIRRPLLGLALTITASWLGYRYAQQYVHPSPRTLVRTPLYAVGDATSVRTLLSGREVVKLGPLPGNFLYGGGAAFASVEDAHAYLRREGLLGLGWGVFEVSGDLDLDTQLVDGERRLNRSVLLVRQVFPNTIARHSSRTWR